MENKTSTFNAATVALLLAAATMAGCGKPAKPDLFANASAPEATLVTPLRPGRWEATASSPELVGTVPPMREPRPEETPQTRTFCLTPAEAATPGPETFLIFGSKSDCERRYWKMADGRVDAELTCKGHAEDIPEYPATISGTYTRDSFDVDARYHALGMDFRQRVEAKRIGECR